MKRTPLYAAHQRLGGKLIEFGGWEMPVQYTSITDEHLAVRKAAGLFDISHMGEVLLSGPGAEAFLNQTLTNDLRKLAPGQGQYTLMCNERGGVIDDLYAYRLTGDEYLLIINASRIDADVAWLERQLAAFPRRSEVQLQNTSDATGALAVQGPACRGVHRPLLPRPFHGRHAGGAGDRAEEEPGGPFQPARRQPSGFRAPATRARTGLKSWPRPSASRRFGTNCSLPARPTA